MSVLDVLGLASGLVAFFSSLMASRYMRRAQAVLDEIRSRRHPVAPPEVNVVDGVILPDVEDPRWRFGREHVPQQLSPGYGNNPPRKLAREWRNVARLGSVRVLGIGSSEAYGIRIGHASVGLGTDEATTYCRAVARVVLDRASQKAIEGPSE